MSSLLYKRLSEEKVFKDPVHSYVHVRDQLIWDLINTPEFQRLRRIKQLGTTYLTFHGAEHSRFNHSLGVYEVTRKIMNNFSQRISLTEEERLLSLSAALLHDIGHGPFSHSFEKVFATNHEEWTQIILQGETKVNQVLKQVALDFPEQVSEVIAKTHQNKLIISLISSQIDADRMDYLLRDAYYTGVNYGNFDIGRILRVMRPHEEYAVIKSSGMHAVEDYIMSRYQMYWQVYFHPVTRSAEVILSKILHRAKHLYQTGYAFKQEPTLLEPLFTEKLSLQDYLALDEAVMMYYFQSWLDEEDGILLDLCDRFINRRLFQYVEYQPFTQIKLWSELMHLFRDVGLDPEYYLEMDSSSDLPYDFYRPGEEGERMPIHLLLPSGELRELSRESEIVEAISGKKRTDHKLYFPLDLLAELEASHSDKVRQIKHLLNLKE